MKLTSRLLAWSSLYIGLIFAIIIPFWKTNSIAVWDTISHYQAIWFVKTCLFPSFTGWNPYAFAGFPQGIFYPPVFHWIGALLSNITSIEISLKSLVVLPILAFPIVSYFFARSYKLREVESFIVVLFNLFAMLVFGERVGGSYQATFINGLVVNNLAIVLFFVFLGLLQRKKMMATALVLSLILLTHLPTALASFFVFFGYLIFEYRKEPRFYIYVLTITCGLTFFWTLPFIFFIREYSVNLLTNVDPLTFAKLGLPLGILWWIDRTRRDLGSIRIIFLSVSVLFVGSFIVYILHKPDIHVYRLLSFVYWVAPFFLFHILKHFGIKFNNLVLGSVLIFYLLTLFSLKIPVLPIIDIRYELKDNFAPERIVTNYKISPPPNMPHYINDLHPIVSGNTPILGLFMENSPNSKYVMHLLKNLSTYNFIWGIGGVPTSGQSLDVEAILKLFNISHILNYSLLQDVKPEDKVVGISPNIFSLLSEDAYSLSLHRIGSTSLVEPLTRWKNTGRAEPDEWENIVDQWFFSNPLGPIPTENLPEFSIQPTTVSLDSISTTQDFLKIHSSATTPAPILIKISYFPKWKAYMQGKEIPIHRAAPNMMVVVGMGDIELRYEDLWLEKTVRIVSFLVFMGFLAHCLIYALAMLNRNIKFVHRD